MQVTLFARVEKDGRNDCRLQVEVRTDELSEALHLRDRFVRGQPALVIRIVFCVVITGVRDAVSTHLGGVVGRPRVRTCLHAGRTR